MRSVHRCIPPICCAAIISGCLPAADRHHRLTSREIDLHAVPISYGFGGRTQTTFTIDDNEWGEIASGFEGVTTAAQERAAIATSIGRFERIAGEQTPTCQDLAMNSRSGPSRGAMDCIDESTNTTTYLQLLDARGLVQFHDLLEPVWRAPHVFDRHRTAVIRDLATGERFAVDSWFHVNGQPAIIQSLENWVHGAGDQSEPDAVTDTPDALGG